MANTTKEFRADTFNIECLPAPHRNTTPKQYAEDYAKNVNCSDDPMRLFLKPYMNYTKEEFISVAYGVGLFYGAVINNLMNGDKLDNEVEETAAKYILHGAAKYADGTGKVSKGAIEAIGAKIALLKWLIILHTSIGMTPCVESLVAKTYNEHGISLDLVSGGTNHVRHHEKV